MNSTIGVNDVPFAQVKPSLLLKHISRANLAVAHAPANRRGLVSSEINIPCSIYTDMRILSSRAMQTVSVRWPPLHTTPHGFFTPTSRYSQRSPVYEPTMSRRDCDHYAPDQVV